MNGIPTEKLLELIKSHLTNWSFVRSLWRLLLSVVFLRDKNSWDGSGVLVDEPMLTTMKNGQKLLSFTFLVIEHFTLANGTPGRHENYFTIEALGRQAETYFRELQIGERYQIKGYLRADKINGIERVRIRCFTILADVINGG